MYLNRTGIPSFEEHLNHPIYALSSRPSYLCSSILALLSMPIILTILSVFIILALLTMFDHPRAPICVHHPRSHNCICYPGPPICARSVMTLTRAASLPHPSWSLTRAASLPIHRDSNMSSDIARPSRSRISSRV